MPHAPTTLLRRYMTLCETDDLRSRIVVYPTDRIVYHTTNADAADAIRQHGFRTGKELGVNERRKAVYFADEDVNPGLYARNDRPDEPYHGQATAHIPINLNGLRLLNVTDDPHPPGTKYTDPDAFPLHKAFSSAISRGDLDRIPLFVEGLIDGTISYLKDGSIYQVCLPRDTANRVLVST